MVKMKLLKPTIFVEQFEDVVRSVADAPEFIRKNSLWKGFFENKGMIIFSAFIALLFTANLVNDVNEFFSQESINMVPSSGDVVVKEAGFMSDTLKDEGKKVFALGGSKYFLLILLEVVIFTFCTKALNILRSRNVEPVLKDFARAEKRMILVMFVSTIKGFVVLLFLKIILGMVGLAVLESPLMFIVYSYFLAYAFFDNYTEQFGFTRKQSDLLIRKHMGAAIGLGLIINIGLYVPLVGPFLVPFLGAIAATLYGDKVKMERAVI